MKMVFAALMSDARKSLKVQAPAKINLFLDVLGQRDTGYHDISSILLPVSLYDELEFEVIDDDFIETSVEIIDGWSIDGDAWKDSSENLVTAAARILKEASGYQGGAKIRLRKTIPIGGGLGGGSSDAAATLKSLNILWETGLPDAQLLEIGFRLGCDVPSLFCCQAVHVQGLGEKVRLISAAPGVDRREMWVVLANPGFSVSTSNIYALCSQYLTSSPSASTNMVSAVQNSDVELAAKNLFNGLEDIVFRKYPIIKMLAEHLVEAGSLGALLSGSGSSLFGLARDEGHAFDVEKRLHEAAGSSVWTRVVKALPDGVMVAHGPLEA